MLQLHQMSFYNVCLYDNIGRREGDATNVKTGFGGLGRMEVTQEDLIRLIRDSIGPDRKQREYEVRLDIAIQLQDRPPYNIWFEPEKGWHVRENVKNKTKVNVGGGFTGHLNVR